MAHLIRIIKARRLKSKWKHYLEEREIGINEDESDVEFPKESAFEQKLQRWGLVKFINKIKTSNTTENFVVKSLIGFIGKTCFKRQIDGQTPSKSLGRLKFIAETLKSTELYRYLDLKTALCLPGGVLLTYIFFFFFYIGVSFSLRTTTYICGLAGIVLCLGLAFSPKVRCYVLLLLPVLFSKQGRQALLAYALFLAFTGPGRNTMHNMGILSESMTCGQEMVRRTLKQIIEMVKAPFRSIKETLKKITDALKEVILAVKNFVMKIKRIIVSILNVVKKATTWLGSIVNFCNKKIGTPFQRCMKTFEDAITDCKAKLGVMDFLCHVVHIVKALCYTVKWLDFICLFTEFVSDKIIGVVKRKLRKFSLQMKTLFYVSIEFSHTYEFETKASNTTKEVTRTVLAKIAKKVERLQSVFSFFGCVFSLLFVFLFFKVYYYKYKFLSSDRYDNVYISKYIVDLDVKRAQMDRETVLPLEPREKRLYAKPTAFRLLKTEKYRILQSMFFLSLTTFKIITFLAVDYSLFWVLMTIYEVGHDALEEVEKSKFGVHVDGEGILANFYRNLGKTFEVPENPNMHLTPLHCLPDPVRPDTGRYIQIGFLVSLCWLLTVTEAYGLRLRNIVMSHYYPDRARERAIWLYNHILRSRGSFLRYARRQLRRKFGEDYQPVEKVTLTQRLFANFPLLGAIFGGSNESNCLLCGIPETKKAPLKRCKTPDCRGRYCLKCFATLENVCTICQHPLEYGDISDISEEIDSSEEDLYSRETYKRNENYVSGKSENEKFLTFKDMELRDRFRDVESNKLADYAKLGDLYHDKAALKKRLKEVLHRHIDNAMKERSRKEQNKQSMYRQVRLKVQDLISDLKRKKPREKHRKSTLRKQFLEKTTNVKNPSVTKGYEYESLLEARSKSSRSRVSFKLDSEEDKESQLDYKTLKDKIKERIKSLKENKSSGFKTSSHSRGGSSSLKTSMKPDNKSLLEDSDDSSKKNFLSYYFVESEKDFGFYSPP